MMSQSEIYTLALQANEARQLIIQMITAAKSGHPGGSLGMADIFTVLYRYHAHHRPQEPEWEGRDRIVLSNGHICPVLYATLALCDYFSKDELLSFRKINSLLQGHPHAPSIPGIENSSGPLGQGTSQAVGMALGLRMRKNNRQVYCLTSDGEHEEGQTWEAIQLAYHYKLNNLIFIVDWNHIQIDGRTNTVNSIDATLAQKYRAFGWRTFVIDGHNYQLIKSTLEEARNNTTGPCVILANTTPGRGVSFMENDYRWHGKAPSDEQTKIALSELEMQRKAILQKMNSGESK